MKITIASGKGGTGKTTVATNLALSLTRTGHRVALLDCDVEEPNCHLFIQPSFEKSSKVTVPVPRVDMEKCTGCGKCAEVCAFAAIAVLGGNVLVFDNLCHSCGGCMLFCPEKAISEVDREIGIVEHGTAKGFSFTQGILNVGEVNTPPLIKEVKRQASEAEIIILDAPPGTSCQVIETIQESDFVLLVTEPTPFGLNDLEIAVEMVRALEIPFAVAVNRHGIGDDRVHTYCEEEGIPLLLEINEDRRIAEAYSVGQLAVEVMPELENKFIEFYDSIAHHLHVGGIGGSDEKLSRRGGG